MKLLLDIGNSLTKTAVYVKGGLEFWSAEPFAEIEKKIPPGIEQIYIANSSRQISNEHLADKIGAKCSRLKLARTQKSHDGLKNSYSRPENLGIDRWLAMVYGWEKLKTGLCIISAGSFVTFDIVQDNGRHSGGGILPGLQLSKNISSDYLGIDRSHTAGMTPGTNTADAVNFGCNLNFCAAVDSLINYYRHNYSAENKVFITGGDLSFAREHIRENAFFEPNMVLKGLSMVADG